MLLNDKARAWANSKEGKEYQRLIFKFLFEWRESQIKFPDYQVLSRSWVESQMLEKYPSWLHEKFLAAIYRLQEHGYIEQDSFAFENEYGAGILVYINLLDKGLANWQKCQTQTPRRNIS